MTHIKISYDSKSFNSFMDRALEHYNKCSDDKEKCRGWKRLCGILAYGLCGIFQELLESLKDISIKEKEPFYLLDGGKNDSSVLREEDDQQENISYDSKLFDSFMDRALEHYNKCRYELCKKGGPGKPSTAYQYTELAEVEFPASCLPCVDFKWLLCAMGEISNMENIGIFWDEILDDWDDPWKLAYREVSIYW